MAQYTKPDAAALRHRIIQARCGGKVQRCHGIPHVGDYSNASHQWGVAILAMQLWPDHPKVNNVIRAALAHDVAEAWVGDVPAPTMRYSPAVAQGVHRFEHAILVELQLPSEFDLPPDEFAMLKACDRLEFMMWCLDQGAMGNRHAEEGLIEIIKYLDTLKLPEPADQLYALLKTDGTLARQSGVMRIIAERFAQEDKPEE
jgi:hypothetical protein